MISWKIVGICLVFIVGVSLSVLSCKESASLDPVLYPYGVVEDDVYNMDSTTILVIDNKFGAIHIEGSFSEDRVFMSQQKLVLAENSTIAESYYDKMHFVVTRDGDSLIVHTDAPYQTNEVKPSCNLGIIMPPILTTIIKNGRDNIEIFYLYANCTIKNTNNHITLTEHRGSCDVRTTGGAIRIENYLPTAGFCKAYSGSGDIILDIPVYTTARVDAMTKDGEIKVTPNLIFTDIEEEGNSFKGTLKTGSGEIFLRTDEGNIELNGFE
jgi:hypothetical protein